MIVGPIVGTRMTSRQDPDLMRGYSRASWLWGLALTGALFYAFVIGRVLLSWVVIKRSLPVGHPGFGAHGPRPKVNWRAMSTPIEPREEGRYGGKQV